MPATFFTPEGYEQERERVKQGTSTYDEPQKEKDKIGGFTIWCLVINRTIGSGIFIQPANVYRHMGSVGGALVIWSAAGIIAHCGLLTWIEIGLSVPRLEIDNGSEKQAVPKNGGEKNYIEYIFRRSQRLATFMYGVPFIILGNLSGNAIAIGIYIMNAVRFANTENKSSGETLDMDTPKGKTLGIATCALTLAVLLHVFSRRGGIFVNNVFAVIKFSFLVLLVIFGIIKAAGANTGGEPAALSNFSNAFSGTTRSASDIALALIQASYTFSGWEQPFYVLGECRNPKKSLPRASIMALSMATVLFVLVNVAFFMVVPKNLLANQNQDLATLFLRRMFGGSASQTAMATIIAVVVIFGNIIVMTFTAARVKAELARQGLLPLILGKGYTTPYAKWKRDRARDKRSRQQQRRGTSDSYEMQTSGTYAITTSDENWPEQTPLPALLLHWFSSMILIAITSMLSTGRAYNALVLVYVYVIIVLIGFAVSGGLVYLRLRPSRSNIKWADKAVWSAWQTSPLAPAIYFLACGFMLFAQFKPPSQEQSNIPYYLIPSIGLSSLLWGSTVYGVLLFVENVILREELVVIRRPFVVRVRDDPRQLIMKSEEFSQSWRPIIRRREV